MMKANHLILLPGLDGTGKLFTPLLRVIPENYQVTVVFYPTDQQLTYEQLKKYVWQALPSAEPFALIAESFSGPLAVEIAATKPKNLGALILCASFIRNPVSPILQFIKILNHPFWFRMHPPLQFVRYAAAMWDCDEIVIKQLIESIREVKPEVLSNRLAQVMQVDVSSHLQTCEVPILYLRAKRDLLVREKSWREIFQLKPETSYQEIDASHFVLQHKPAEAWAAISDFLSQC